MQCTLCESDEESETHLLKCKTILDSLDNQTDIQNASYEHIFSKNIDEQVSITKIFSKVLKKRNILLKQKQQ